MARSKGNSDARPEKPGATTIAARLAAIGLVNDWDFVLHLPLRFEDETQLTPIDRLTAGEDALVEAQVVDAKVVFRGRRQLHVTVRDASGTLALRFLNFYSSQVKQMAPGQTLRIFGAARSGLAGFEMVHPRVRVADREVALPSTLTPVYPSTEGVPQAWLRKRIDRALASTDLHDLLPSDLLKRWQLPALSESILRLHRPPPNADQTALTERTDPAWRRLKFDELLAQQIELKRAHAARHRHPAHRLAADAGLTRGLLAALPFALTVAQQRVWSEVERDLALAHPMQRLVQGDVGSGKTVVAALAAARAIESGFQASLMAPTELLAEQHFRRVAEWLAPLGVRVTWLTGRLTAAEKRSAHQVIGQGDAQLVVGTHALIQDAVEFARLGLAIIDEQHRFGVAQRLALRAAKATMPHMLMLSATPIPGTVAMSYLADLDVSTIDVMPPGRKPVATKLISARRREEVMERIRAEARAGRQVYWVCPLIEASDVIEAKAALDTHGRISELLPELAIGLLHGQLPAVEKAAVMERFVNGTLDVLVATTVVEVGVDVANAALMVIEHAERFGLAQLHQLRGRVGRGTEQSFCILLYEEPLSEAARERLKIIYECSDGFEVARRDLMMRGPGEFLGSRQSGQPLLRFADPERDAELVEAARAAAETLLSDDAATAREHARRWYEGRHELLAA